MNETLEPVDLTLGALPAPSPKPPMPPSHCDACYAPGRVVGLWVDRELVELCLSCIASARTAQAELGEQVHDFPYHYPDQASKQLKPEHGVHLLPEKMVDDAPSGSICARTPSKDLVNYIEANGRNGVRDQYMAEQQMAIERRDLWDVWYRSRRQGNEAAARSLGFSVSKLKRRKAEALVWLERRVNDHVGVH